MATTGTGHMQVEVSETSADACAVAAGLIAGRLKDAVARRGHATVAFSGGNTPVPMFGVLAQALLPWTHIDVFQVDERAVDVDNDRSNMRGLRAALNAAGVPPGQIHRMPVCDEVPDSAAARYLERLCAVAGTPPVLDVVHLGLGVDGHTASLFPEDATLAAVADIGFSRVYEGVRRMTLTLPALNRARSRVWLVTGADKRRAVARLIDADAVLVASRVARADSVLVLDRDAAP